MKGIKFIDSRIYTGLKLSIAKSGRLYIPRKLVEELSITTKNTLQFSEFKDGTFYINILSDDNSSGFPLFASGASLFVNISRALWVFGINFKYRKPIFKMSFCGGNSLKLTLVNCKKR